MADQHVIRTNGSNSSVALNCPLATSSSRPSLSRASLRASCNGMGLGMGLGILGMRRCNSISNISEV
jgi:hypothetical protein